MARFASLIVTLLAAWGCSPVQPSDEMVFLKAARFLPTETLVALGPQPEILYIGEIARYIKLQDDPGPAVLAIPYTRAEDILISWDLAPYSMYNYPSGQRVAGNGFMSPLASLRTVQYGVPVAEFPTGWRDVVLNMSEGDDFLIFFKAPKDGDPHERFHFGDPEQDVVVRFRLNKISFADATAQ